MAGGGGGGEAEMGGKEVGRCHSQPSPAKRGEECCSLDSTCNLRSYKIPPDDIFQKI